uniref:Orf104c n=1 Tax=Batis maritima TaxID=4436 RepID=A0A068BBM4_BATMA|nr:orf104c [Batis maritima]AIC83330.1 orf104c [Batis maritima]
MRSERTRIRKIGYANDSGGGLVVRIDLLPFFALVSVFCFCCCCLGRLHEIIRSQCCVRNASHDPRCTKFVSVGNSFFLLMSETLLSAMLYTCATIALHERGHRK